MKTIYLLLILLTSLTFGQTFKRTGTASYGAILPQGIRWQALNSNGYSHNFPTSLSQISGSNPAALNNFDTLAFGISYQYDTRIDTAFLSDIAYEHSYPLLPQSIAFVYPIDDVFTLGFSAAQKFNSIMDFGEIAETTPEQPLGTGETFSPRYQTNIYSISAILAFDMSETLSGLSTAFRFNYDNFWFSNKILNTNAEATGSAASFALGLSYKTETEMGQVELAGFFEYGIDISTFSQYSGSDLQRTVQSDTTGTRGEQFYALSPPKFEVIALLPNRWHLGANLNNEFGRFLIDLAYIDWASTGAFKNNLEFSFSYGRQMSENFYLSFGLFNTNRKYESESLTSWNNFDATFFTFGVQTTFNGLDIDLSIADSHLSSDKWRKQTITKIAVGKSL